jgi:hypothetical protein
MQFVLVDALPSQRARITLAASLLVFSGWAHAHIFCVSTASAFQAALTQSSDGGIYAGEDNAILLVGNTYTTGAATGNAPFHYYLSNTTHAIQIYGGYATNCNPRTALTPPTILDGGGNTGVLSVGNKFGSIMVSQLTLQNGESGTPGAGLQVNYLVSVNADVDIHDVIIRNNHSTVSAGGLYASAGGYGGFTANLITGNSADGQYGAGYVTGYGSGSVFYNNTVSKNTSTAATNPTGGLYCGGTAPCEMHNNIFWNNTTYGVYLGNSNAFLSYNDIGTQGGTAPGTDYMNLSVAPKFVDAINDNFRLAGDSPLLGYGVLNGTTYDLDGHQYATLGKLDLGPYAETIFTDDFEDG